METMVNKLAQKNKRVGYVSDSFFTSIYNLNQTTAIKYTKEDDEYLLYDPESIPVENFDVALLSNVECKTIDVTQGFIETEISV